MRPKPKRTMLVGPAKVFGRRTRRSQAEVGPIRTHGVFLEIDSETACTIVYRFD